MNNTLNVALIQTELHWEDPEMNRSMFDTIIKQLSDSVDLIVLPEMFTTGFTMNAEKVAENMDGNTLIWMKRHAKLKNCAITGSIVIQEDKNFYNRLLFVYPNGNIVHYDKKHTFTLAGEQKVYTSGKKQVLVNFKGWKILPLVCYDLRFPVWSRNTMAYDLLIYVANWPKVRISAWDTLLKARAIENMSYCIGVNRVGPDGNNHDYSGHSAAYDVLGRRLDSLGDAHKTIEMVTLEKKHIKTYRSKLGFLDDADGFTLK